MKVTKEEIEKIASLAKLELTEEELGSFVVEFESILNYVSLIDECDTSSIENSTEIHFMDDYVGEIFQEDVPKPSMSHEDVFLNVPDSRRSGNHFRTSKIVNKE